MGKQYTIISLSLTTYHLLLHNLVSVGCNAGVSINKDYANSKLVTHFTSSPMVNEVETPMAIIFYHTTCNVLVQLKGKRCNEWSQKIQAIEYFVRNVMEPVIRYVEQTREYDEMKEAFKTWLQNKLESPKVDENKVGIELNNIINPKMEKVMKAIGAVKQSLMHVNKDERSHRTETCVTAKIVESEISDESFAAHTMLGKNGGEELGEDDILDDVGETMSENSDVSAMASHEPVTNAYHLDESLECDKLESSCKCGGKDDTNMMQCSTCKTWMHYACTDLPIYMIKQLCSKTNRKFDCQTCVGVSDVDSLTLASVRVARCTTQYDDDQVNILLNEKNELTAKVELLNIMVEEEKDEIKTLKKKDSEEKRKNDEQIKSLKSEVKKLKDEKSLITTLSKQSKENLTGQVNSLKCELKAAKQEKEIAEKRAKSMKETQDKQAKTIELQAEKIKEIKQKVDDQNDPELSKEKITELEKALISKETLYNSVITKMSSMDKEQQGNKVKLQKAESEIHNRDKKIAELQNKMNVKDKEIASHVEVVSKIIEHQEKPDETSANSGKSNARTESPEGSQALDNGTNDEEVEKDSADTHAKKIKDLKKTIRGKDTEIRSWKSKFAALEGTLGDANLQLSNVKEQVLSSKAEAAREKEINDSLLVRIKRLQSEVSTPMASSHDTPSLSIENSCMQTPRPISTTRTRLNNAGFSTPRQDESLYSHEYVNVDTWHAVSPNAQDMMTTHVSSATMDEMQRATEHSHDGGSCSEQAHAGRNAELSGYNEVCVHSFKAKRPACPGSCPYDHNLDYAKIMKGICFFEFAKEGSCKRGNECWFTHQIPNQLRSDPQMLSLVSQSLGKIQLLRQNTQRKKLPVEITTPEQSQQVGNFLPYQQRPVLQGSLPSQNMVNRWGHPQNPNSTVQVYPNQFGHQNLLSQRVQ